MSLKSATGISSFFDIFEIARTPKLAFQYLEEQGAFFKSRKCAYGWSMTLAKRTNRSWFWRCNSRSCKCKRSQMVMLAKRRQRMWLKAF
ncbi:hypothetical protein AB4K20DRAFT_1963215 [Rhizopus microsporus]